MTALPKAANSDRLDLFWGPAHRLPFRLAPHIPTILTIHDLVWRKAPKTMRWQTWLGEYAFMRKSLRSADYIAADSQATAKDIIELCPDTVSRTRVVYPGLTRLPQPGGRAMLPLDSNGKSASYALFVGTLEPRKNLLRLLQAFALARSRGLFSLKLVIAGGQGWHLHDLTSHIDQLGLQSCVILTGYVSDAELAQLYASAEFLLMPSLYEGFGFPIIEAQSFGVPVITSNRSSMPEVAGQGAVYVEPENISDIANAINTLSSDAFERERLSVLARLNSSRFSWRKSAETLLAV